MTVVNQHEVSDLRSRTFPTTYRHMEATQQADAADILTDIEAFRQRVGLPETTFGRRAIGDANLIDNLRSGRELRRATERKVRDFMASYTPTQAEQAAA